MRTAIWRRRLQAKYPGDGRNGKAAVTLDKLAGETNELTDEQWSQIVPFYSWASPTWSDAVSLASRHVEFQRNVRTFPAYVSNLIGILTEQNAAIN
jgi:hypothetical protein